MGGVSLILKALLDEKDPEAFSGQFALTNAVKCIEPGPTMTTRPTRAMIENCALHLAVEIRLLRPHLIITQGRHPRKTLLRYFEGDARLKAEFGSRGKAALYATGRVLLLVTPHPARLSGFKWKKEVLPPFLRKALTHTRRYLAAFLRRGGVEPVTKPT